MKTTIVVLVLIAIMATFSMTTGIKRISSSNLGGVNVSYHDTSGRVLAAITSVLSAAAAIGCSKRRMYGWWIVTTILAIFLIVSVVWAIWKMSTFDLPMSAMLLGGLGELLKIAFWSWFLFGFWKRRKEYFQQLDSKR